MKNITSTLFISTKAVFGFLLFNLYVNVQVRAQGCSDAGFCTIGAMAPSEATDSSYRHNAFLAGNLGVGEQKVLIYQVIPEIRLSLFQKYSLQAKWPYVLSNGNLGGSGGIGDLMLSLSRTLGKNWSITAGTRLPTGSTSQVKSESERRPLPMPYQPGLGTTDLIAGIAWQNKGWQISAGYQQVLDHNNKNRFLHSRWEDIEEAKNYFESNHLLRGDDALLRAEYGKEWKNYRLSGGLLAIFRLEEDAIRNEDGLQSIVKGSDGLTLNLNLGISRSLGQQDRLSLMYASPLIVRDARPDGLTRSMVLMITYQINFNR